MCSLLWLKRGCTKWEGSRRLTPQACELSRPQHRANESEGSGWAHTGGQGLLPVPKRSQRKNPEDKRREGDQEGRLQSFCKQKSDNHCNMVLMDIHYLE